MSNKKKFPKLAVLSLLGLLALTSCGSDDNEIQAKPSNYDKPIVSILEDKELEKVQNNVVSIIADQMKDGEIPSKTLDKVLYQFAQSVYGSYNKVTRAEKDTATTLKEAVRIYEENDTKNMETLYQFIRDHKVYWTYSEKGKHINDDDKDPAKWKEVTDDKTFIPCSSEILRVSAKFYDIEKRIAENMYSKATTGGYTSKHFFKEIDYLKSLYDAGQNVKAYKEAEDLTTQIPDPDDPEKTITVPYVRARIIDYTMEDEEVFSEEILHREFYQTNYGVGKPEDEGAEQYHYIEKEIVPEVYSDLLVEQYLLDNKEESSAVNQSRARLINTIKIDKSQSYYNGYYLTMELMNEIYAQKPTGDYVAYIDEANNPFKEIFTKYEDISKGLTVIKPLKETDPEFMKEDDIVDEETFKEYWSAEQIISRCHNHNTEAFKYVEDSGFKYYKETTYGDLVEDYIEFKSATSFDEIDTSLRDKFTSSGTVSPEEGFDQEVIGISQGETITKGWFIQKSAPTLDSEGKAKEALFQLSVANNKIELKKEPKTDEEKAKYVELGKTDRYVKDSEGHWVLRDHRASGGEGEGKENKFICSINGSYFLKREKLPSGSDYKEDIIFEDSDAYYICQVVEAVKDVKLRNSEYSASYANTRGQLFLSDVISEVTTKVAETGNYSSLSKEYWLEKMDIKYHDQKVYDYFKSNYPDLFEDEDE